MIKVQKIGQIILISLNFFKRYEYKLCSLIREAKNDYYRNEVMNINNCDKYYISANKQVCYNIIEEVINIYDINNRAILQIIHENELTNVNMDTNKCVNILNNYFYSADEKIAGQIQSDNEMHGKINSTINNIEYRDHSNKDNLDYNNSMEKDLLLIIKTLRKRASPGFDNISSNTLIQIADYIIILIID